MTTRDNKLSSVMLNICELSNYLFIKAYYFYMCCIMKEI